MESDGDDLENIFEEYEHNGNVDEAENTENKTANETPGAVKIAAPKRVVKNPRLKFNAERLCGERGIPVLMNHFKNVKFRGLGYEKEDLDTLLSKLEHWTHRLYPSMKFEDCLTHIEKLGKKRPVQTCLRKIRLDMPILNSDFVKDDDDDDDEIKRNEDPEPEEINAFDRLLGESQEMSNIDVSVSENVSNTSFFYSSPVVKDSSAHVLGSSFGSSLTDEQKERMERNKMLAAERRKARLAAMEQNSAKSQSESHTTTFIENGLSEQNSFDKLLDSTECNEKNAKKNLDLEASHDNDKSLKNVDNDNSEELGLEDLMNLVDEKEPIIGENAVKSPSEKFDLASGYMNETSNKALSADAENLKSFHSVSEDAKTHIISSSKESESSLKENLNMESSFDSICETSMSSKENADIHCSTSSILLRDENMLMKDKDLISMNCENENFNNDSGNVNEINKLSGGDVEKFKTYNSISDNTENILLDTKNSLKSSEEISNMELDLVCEASADSKINIHTGDSTKNTSVCDDENVIMENDDVVSMDCENENF